MKDLKLQTQKTGVRLQSLHVNFYYTFYFSVLCIIYKYTVFDSLKRIDPGIAIIF